MTSLPPGVRRNTFSGSNAKASEPGERRDPVVPAGLRRALAENTRDQDDAQRATVATEPLTLQAFYEEPFFLGLESEPSVGIICARVRKVSDEEAPIPGAASLVHFWWDGASSRAVITKIDGLTVGTEYKFNFWVIG